MSGGRPRTTIGTYGTVYVMRKGDCCVAETRFRDLDGRLRKVTATAGSPSAARAQLKERLLNRTGYGSGGVLSLTSPFGDLVALWLAELELRGLAEGTKESYRDQVRLHVLPAFEHYTLGEITTGRVEWFLKSQAAISHSRAKQSRTMLNLLFGFANRNGGPLSPYNVRRTFRDFLDLAGLGDSGISLRWYRRTGATVIARGMGTDAAAAFLGHSSTVITEADQQHRPTSP